MEGTGQIQERENMPRNNLTDLNNHLFEQLERLNDEELSDESLQKEFKRADAMSKIASQIIDNGKLELDAVKVMYETGVDITSAEIPQNLIGTKK